MLALSGMVATIPQAVHAHASATNASNLAVQYADSHWNWDFFDPNNHGTVAPGTFQPNFQCAEFVSRALSTEGVFLGLGPDDAQSSYANYLSGGTDYQLWNVGSNPTTNTGLYDYLTSHGGTDIGDAPQNAAPGDPVFFGDIGNMDHVEILIQTGAAPDGSDTLIDAHNFAQFYQPYSGGGLAIHIVHIAVNSPSPLAGDVAYATPSWVGRNSDLRLEAFRQGDDGAVWHVWQKCVNCGWSSWASLGKPSSSVTVNGQPVVIQNMLNDLEVFVRGSDGAIWHIWQTSSGWSGWSSLGGQSAGQPTVAINGLNGLEVFTVNRNLVNGNLELWHIWQSKAGSSWSNWASLGGSLGGDPIVTHNGAGNMEVFVEGSDAALWHIWQTQPGGAWQPWASLGGALGSTPAVEHNVDGRMEVFATNASGTGLSHIWQTQPGGGWSSWQSFGGAVTGVPSVALNPLGNLEVFARGTDGSLQHIWETGSGWSGWSSLGGSLGDNPAVSINHTGNMEVFSRFSNATIDHLWQNGGGGSWTSWNSLEGSFAS